VLLADRLPRLRLLVGDGVSALGVLLAGRSVRRRLSLAKLLRILRGSLAERAAVLGGARLRIRGRPLTKRASGSLVGG
jgi:hypothetical protein